MDTPRTDISAIAHSVRELTEALNEALSEAAMAGVRVEVEVETNMLLLSDQVRTLSLRVEMHQRLK